MDKWQFNTLTSSLSDIKDVFYRFFLFDIVFIFTYIAGNLKFRIIVPTECTTKCVKLVDEKNNRFFCCLRFVVSTFFTKFEEIKLFQRKLTVFLMTKCIHLVNLIKQKQICVTVHIALIVSTFI